MKKLWKSALDISTVLIICVWVLNVLMIILMRPKEEVKNFSTRPRNPPVRLPVQNHEKYLTCYKQIHKSDRFKKFDAKRDVNTSRQRIFFLDTSCNRNDSSLKCRDVCALESTAFNNPKANVYFLFLNPDVQDSQKNNQSEHLLEILQSTYSNVVVRQINLKEYLSETPVSSWFDSENLWSSLWPAVELANILRMITLWKYGGIYLDLDFVITKSLEDLHEVDFIGFQNNRSLNTAGLGLNNHGIGLELSTIFLLEVKENLKKNTWGRIGVRLMNQIVKKYCNVTQVTSITKEKCKGLTILKPEEFYPLDYLRWRRYFDDWDMNGTMEAVERSRGVHLWNSLSRLTEINYERKVPYTIIAEKHCPVVYQYCSARQMIF